MGILSGKLIMSKYPSEIFGYYWENVSDEANKTRDKYFCPFHGSKCFKQSRLIEIPFGVCTAHVDGSELALCPRRFLEGYIVFKDIALHYFQNCDNILVFSEVGLKGIGSFDFVMIKHKPMSIEIEDFVVIEFQTGQTTSTGKLVEGFLDFQKHGKILPNTSYGFGINSYDIWKRTFTQVLNKGIIVEKWGKKIYWVIQEQIFNYFQNKYRLNELSYDSNHSTIFSLYDLNKNDEILNLKHVRLVSSTIDELFNAFRKNDEIPPVEVFINRLQEKVSKDIKLSLRLDTTNTQVSYLDAPKPSSTGRFKQNPPSYQVEIDM